MVQLLKVFRHHRLQAVLPALLDKKPGMRIMNIDVLPQIRGNVLRFLVGKGCRDMNAQNNKSGGNIFVVNPG